MQLAAVARSAQKCAQESRPDAVLDAALRLRSEIRDRELATARQRHKAALSRWVVQPDRAATAALCRAIETEYRCRQRARILP